MAADLTSRRSALTGFAVTAVAAVAGYLVARNSSAAQAKRPTTAANGYGAPVTGSGQRLASAGQVPAGGGLILSDPQIVLTRDATERFTASPPSARIRAAPSPPSPTAPSAAPATEAHSTPGRVRCSPVLRPEPCH